MNSFIFRRSFWGILLVVIGGVWLMENLFDFDFPLFRVLFSIALIALGILLIKGIPFRGTSIGTRTAFSETNFTMQPGDREHSVVFGQVKLDLGALNLTESQTIHLKCVFGEMHVRIPSGMNYEIQGEFSFCSVMMPDGSNYSFGNKAYRQFHFDAAKPVLTIKAHCVFGEMRFINV